MFSQIQGNQSAKTPFPKQQSTVFTYVGQYSLTSAGGTPSTQIFRLNSLFDFDYTNVGKQPFMYDQMMTVYNRYRVLNVELDIWATNTDSALMRASVLSIYPSNLNTPVATYLLAAEQPFAQIHPLSCPAGNKDLINVKAKFNVATVLGYKQNVDDDLSALYTANPNQVAFLHMVIDNQDQTSAYSVSLIVKARIYSLVYDLKSPGESLQYQLTQKVDDKEQKEKDQSIDFIEPEMIGKILSAHWKVNRTSEKH